MSETTPTPWRTRDGQGAWWTIEAEVPSINGLACWYVVARCDFDMAADGYTEGRLNPEADAALIVRAVNAHQALMDALEDILRISRHDDSALCVARIVDVARAALAKAAP